MAGEKTRVKRKILMDDKSRGGLQIPNLEMYQDAICLTWMKE